MKKGERKILRLVCVGVAVEDSRTFSIRIPMRGKVDKDVPASDTKMHYNLI